MGEVSTLSMVDAMTDQAVAQPAERPMTNLNRLRSILGGSAGNLVEWYDWFAYASFALYFAPIFFPEGDQTSQLLQTAAVFAVGFFARPVGAWIMGLYADRAGRRAAMTVSVAMMCFGSLVIALVPEEPLHAHEAIVPGQCFVHLARVFVVPHVVAPALQQLHAPA